MPTYDWKLFNENNTIAGIPVKKAICKLADGTNVVAWYAPKFNYKNGPDKFWGLPGIILSIETRRVDSDGSVSGEKYIATKINVDKNAKPIQKQNPKETITSADFNAKMEEFNKVLFEQYGGGVDVSN